MSELALERYKVEQAPNEIKRNLLKAIKSGEQTGLNLGQAESDKLRQRFPDADTSQLSEQALNFAFQLINTWRDYAKSKVWKAWVELVDDSHNLSDMDTQDADTKDADLTDINKLLDAAINSQINNNDIIWQRADCYQVLLFLVGAERIDFIERAWKDIPTQSYQSGWYRRSFRINANHRKYFEKRIQLLIGSVQEIQEGKFYYELPKLAKVRLAWDFHRISMADEWAAEIDMAEDLEKNELFCLMRDIIYNRDEGSTADEGTAIVGKVSREIIKALLASSRVEAWELVKDLLLTAQRQEGLRQTILEALDEGSRGAIPYFVDVILEHNLTRFSSVVRAIDVWTGMVWQADKATACKKFLQSTKQFFDKPQLLEKKLESQNNLEVLASLWVTSIDDVNKTIPMIENLIQSGKIEKVALAMYFVNQWDLPELEIPLYVQVLQSDKLTNNLLSLASALSPLAGYCGRYGRADLQLLKQYEHLYQGLNEILKQSEIKEKSFAGKVFSWLEFKYKRADIYQVMASIAMADVSLFQSFITEHGNELPLEIRENVVSMILKHHSYYFNKAWAIDRRAKTKAMTDIQRYCAMTFLNDRSDSVGNQCAMALIDGKLLTDELPKIEEMFGNKGKLLGKRLQYVMLGQSTAIAMQMAESLIHSDNTQQRLAGLELALELSQDNNKQDGISDTDKMKVAKWVEDYENNLPKSKNGKSKKLTKAETALLKRFETIEEGVLSAENGWGLYDPNNISPYNEPVFDETSYFASIAKLPQNKINKGKHEFGLSKPLDKIIADLEQLKQIYVDNAEYEYEVEQWDGSIETVLLGNGFRSHSRDLSPEDGKNFFEGFPLWTMWEDWFKKVKWQPRDLFIVLFETETASYYRWDDEKKAKEPLLENYPDYFPNIRESIPKLEASAYRTPLTTVLETLSLQHPFEQKNDYLLSACQCLYSQLDAEILNWKYAEEGSRHRHRDRGNGWQSLSNASVFLWLLIQDKLTDKQAIQAWHLYRWWQRSGLVENISTLRIPLEITAKAFKANIVNQDELREVVIQSSGYHTNISWLSNITHEKMEKNDFKPNHPIHDAPILWEMINQIREFCLDIELKRGEIETPVSHLIAQFKRFYGVNRLVEAINGLGKKNLYANYLYGVERGSKAQMMSYLVANTHPLPTDTQEVFNQVVTQAKINEERLVQIAIYAPQWQPFVEAYLQWEGLASGIWWMNAHTKTSEYESKSAQEESEIAKYSTIDLNEFKRGAVDIDWFNQAYALLGKKRWAILYDCAKFISDGNGHRRAKLYSDVLTNELKIREVTKKVKEKRDQDFVRLYGLVPLSKTNAEKDVLTRYTYLQKFKKESRQFGSQRQASEGLSVQVAMDNLARTAGYPDPLRLGWAMESKAVQQILDAGTRVELDETVIELVIDDNGKTDIMVEKTGKTQKSIPAKYRKHADVVELKKHKKTLTEQFRRAKASLEDSMVRGDVFTAKELGKLFEHPVISKLLAKLVFISEDNLGFFDKGKLVDYAEKSADVSADSQLRIAHCVDLHQAGSWRDYQSYCFDKELKQPFKQIFRELYLPTPDELAEKTTSRRYAGHQVQPAKTVALLKSRGWRVDYEEGLQKVYHKAGFRVKLYAMADWFSPADTESPTLETVEFHRLRRLDIDSNTDKKLSYNVPFDDVDPRIFSEVMRDIDLVVSVAHVGEVDPEASQSSIELRAVLLAETMRLFKLENVEIKDKHAIIDGSMAKYSVHLGSAVAHQVAGSYLSILPVHSQHRGRIFLPFMDDDPKTAELMAKVLLLAKDNEIQDPTVLRQIKSHSKTKK